MSLGYALLHSHRVETALSSEAQKLRFDDGADVAIATMGAQGLTDTPERVLEELVEELKGVVGDFAGLFGGDGPFAPWIESLRKQFAAPDLDLGALVERAAKFFCEFDPLAVRALFTAVIERFESAGPIAAKIDFGGRVKRLLTVALEAYEKPLLSGRDDRHAHRSFRAALILRTLIDPLLDRIGGLFAELGLSAMLRDLSERVPKLEGKVIARAKEIGCWIEQFIVPLFKVSGQLSLSFSASVSVDVGGPQPMADAEPSFRDDDKIVSFPRGTALWTTDLICGIVATITSIFDMWREGSTRAAEVIADVALALWQSARTFFRAYSPKYFFEHPGFGTWLFTESGDFFVQTFLHFIGSLADIAKGPNWIMNFGPRIVRYFAVVVQPRVPYLFARSLWYFKEYDKANSARPEKDRDRVSFARHAWFTWSFGMFVAVPLLWIFCAATWEAFDLQKFGGLLAFALSFGGVGMIIGHIVAAAAYSVPGTIGFPNYAFEIGRNILPIVAPIFVLVVAVEAFGNTDPAEKSPGLRTALRVVYVVLGAWSAATLFARIPDNKNAAQVLDRITLTFWYVVGGFAVAAALPGVLWNYIINDGRDHEDIFDALQPATSPYLLPYPSGDRWLCGQGFHGMYSHTWNTRNDMLLGKQAADNHCAYDFNEGFGARVFAARPGVVVRIEASQENGNFNTPNRVMVMHVERGPGHDPGSDDEHAITFVSYLHLAKDSPRAHLHQFVDRGFHVASVDDTGVSALHHLHFQGSTQQRWSEFSSSTSHETIPVKFKDDSLRTWRPWSHTDGKPRSACFFTSDNKQPPPRPRPMWLRVGDVAAGTFTAIHDLLIRVEDLRGNGTDLPETVVLRTVVKDGHYHVVRLSRQQLKDLIERTSLAAPIVTEGAAVASHTHQLEGEIHRIDDDSADTAEFAVVAPPSARLLARKAEPYELLGERLVLRVNQRTTEFFRYSQLANATHATAAEVAGLVPAVRIEGPLRRACNVRDNGTAVVVLTDAAHKLTITTVGGVDPFGFQSAAGGTAAATSWSATFDDKAMATASIAYDIRVVESTSIVSQTLAEVIAAPAYISAVTDVVYAELSAANPLVVVVLSPGVNLGDPDVRDEHTVALDGIANQADLLARLQTSLPLVTPTVVANRVELRTIGGGTSWKMELRGPRALAALGFDLERVAFDLAADGTRNFDSGAILTVGRGNVGDSRHVSRENVRNAIDEALACMTAQASRAFLVEQIGGDILLSTPGKKITLASDPPELASRITTAAPVGDTVRIGAGTFDLPNGWLEVRVGGELTAAAAFHGRQAAVEASLPGDPTAELNAWFGKAFSVRVDGAPSQSVTLVSGGAANLLAAAIDSFTSQVPQVWVGVLVQGGTSVLRIASRTRGSTSQIELDFTASFTGQGPFGLPLVSTATGGGSVANLAAVTIAELKGLIEVARSSGAGRQKVIAAKADGEGLRVNAIAGTTIALTQTVGTIPGNVTLQRSPERVDQLVQPAADAYLTPRQVESGVQAIQAQNLAESAAPAQRVSVLHAGDPATIGPLRWPADVAKFNGKTLSIQIDGARVDVSFSGLAGTQARMQSAWVRRLEAACGSRVLVRGSAADPNALAIETVHVGGGARLQLLAAPGGSADGLPLFVGAPVSEAKGQGFAADLRVATPAEYAAAFDKAIVSRESVSDSALRDELKIARPHEPYTPPTPTAGSVTATSARTVTSAEHFILSSQRSGCASSLEQLIPCVVFDFDRSLAHAPANKASAAIDSFDVANPTTATRALSGKLVLRFNDNGTAPDIARATTVEVDFAAGNYTARQVAQTIDAACATSGVATAAAYPDGSIVIETFARGLLGLVEVVDALGLPFQRTRSRGWPGAGEVPGDPLKIGFRSKPDIAAKKVGTKWNFATGPTTVTIEIRADHTMESLANEIDEALRTAGPSSSRIGVCRVGDDGALYIESTATTGTFMFTVDGVTLTAGIKPVRTGDGWDLTLEPGLGLRSTNVLRTHRLAYRVQGFADAWSTPVWVRPPTEGDLAATGKTRGAPLAHQIWPDGHFLLAARSEAAKTDGYTAAGEMVASSGEFTAAGGELVPFVRQARYWVSSPFPVLGLEKLGSEVLLRVVAPKV